MNEPMKAVRSEDFFLDDGNFYVKVDNTVHCVHRSLFQAHSLAFNDMFTLGMIERKIEPGRGLGRATDGLSEENPFVLFNIKLSEFTNLLKALYNPFRVPPFDVAELVDILKLSTLFGMSWARKWAIHFIDELSKIGVVTAPLQLRLCTDYRVRKWLSSSFRRVASYKLGSLTNHDMLLLGVDILVIVVRLQVNIQKDTSTLAHIPPECLATATQCIEDPERHAERCEETWAMAWWNVVGRGLLHFDPLVAYTKLEALKAIDSLKEPGMVGRIERKCLLAAIEGVDRDALGRSFDLVTEAMDEVKLLKDFVDWPED